MPTIIRLFYETETSKITAKTVAKDLEGKYSVDNVIFPDKHERAGEIVVDAGYEITEAVSEELSDLRCQEY